MRGLAHEAGLRIDEARAIANASEGSALFLVHDAMHNRASGKTGREKKETVKSDLAEYMSA